MFHDEIKIIYNAIILKRDVIHKTGSTTPSGED